MSRSPSLGLLTLACATLCSCAGDDLVLPGGGPGDMVAVSGDGQEGRTGQRLNDPLVVQVNDDQGRPAPGASVSFAGADGSPAVDPASATTDADGQASTRVTLGDAEGAQSIQAQVTGAGLSVEFHVTALAPPGNPGGGGDHPGNGGGDDRGNHGGHGGHHGHDGHDDEEED